MPAFTFAAVDIEPFIGKVACLFCRFEVNHIQIAALPVNGETDIRPEDFGSEFDITFLYYLIENFPYTFR